jgi:hypothetical protein
VIDYQLDWTGTTLHGGIPGVTVIPDTAGYRLIGYDYYDGCKGHESVYHQVVFQSTFLLSPPLTNPLLTKFRTQAVPTISGKVLRHTFHPPAPTIPGVGNLLAVEAEVLQYVLGTNPHRIIAGSVVPVDARSPITTSFANDTLNWPANGVGAVTNGTTFDVPLNEPIVIELHYAVAVEFIGAGMVSFPYPGIGIGCEPSFITISADDWRPRPPVNVADRPPPFPFPF